MNCMFFAWSLKSDAVGLDYRDSGFLLGDTTYNDEFLELIYQGNKLILDDIIAKDIKSKYSKANWVASVGYALIIDGKINLKKANKFDHSNSPNPRTMIGQRANGDIVFVVTDGRSKDSKGLVAQQQAEIMLGLNCALALNCDGGGSSELIVKDKIINKLDGGERALPQALLVYSKENVNVEYGEGYKIENAVKEVDNMSTNVQIKQDLIPIDNYKRKGIGMTPKYITIHSTANPNSTAQNERGWLTNTSNKVQASWHYVVGDNIIIQAVPDKEVAFHAGNKDGNYNSIGIEMVESGNREKVIANTIELVVMLMKKYNIGFDKVVRHYDWLQSYGRKNCPRILNTDSKWTGWNKFKADLEKKLNAKTETTKKEDVKVAEKVKEIPTYKTDAIKESLKNGLLTSEEWINKAEEKADVWMICTMMNRLFNEIKK